jgi:hypothetical protein
MGVGRPHCGFDAVRDSRRLCHLIDNALAPFDVYPGGEIAAWLGTQD